MSGCVKKAHPTREAAEKFAKEWAARHPDAAPQHAYLCEEHGCWHLSTRDAVAHGLERSGLGSSNITPVATPSKKPIFTPKKIDKGHALTLQDLVLEKLQKTFLTDTSIAEQLSCDYWTVYDIRIANKIHNAFQRQRNAVLNLLASQPDRSRVEIVRVLGISDWYVKAVVKELGLAGTAKHKSGRRGVKHQNFGKHHSKELRAIIAERTKEAESTPEWRTRASLRAKTKNNLPTGHEVLSAISRKSWSLTPEERAKKVATIREAVDTPEARERNRAGKVAYWASPEGCARKQKLSAAWKNGKAAEMKKKQQQISDATRQKISEAGKRRVVSEQTRAKLSAAKKGRVPWTKGKTFTAEHRRKIAEAAKAAWQRKRASQGGRPQ